MSKRNCSDCGKPLGSTIGKCHECGGESKRADSAGTFKTDRGLFGLADLMK